MGIEPTTSAWKAEVIPLNYTRIISPALTNWSERQDLNLRHPAPKAGALPNCATPRIQKVLYYLIKQMSRENIYFVNHEAEEKYLKSYFPFALQIAYFSSSSLSS